MGFLAALALVAVAAVHLMIWLPRFDPEARTYDARDSWLARRAEVDEEGSRRAALVGAIAVAAILVFAAVGALGGAGWAAEAAAAGAVLSLLLSAVYFHPWLAVLMVVDLAVVVIAL